MMCNVALERRMGFLSLDAGDLTQDMFTIMTALKGLYLLSCPHSSLKTYMVLLKSM